jgi:hypothetical protein
MKFNRKDYVTAWVMEGRDRIIEGERGNKEQVLPTAIEALRRQGLAPWLCCGTLLGLHRDDKLIPGDNDIDIGVLHHWGDRPNRPRLGPEAQWVNMGTYRGQLTQFKFLMEGVLVDVIHHYWGLPGDGVTVITCRGLLHYPKELFQGEIEERETSCGILPMPPKVEELLAFHYGEDWKTPQKGRGIWPE